MAHVSPDVPLLEHDPTTVAMLEPSMVVGGDGDAPEAAVVCFFREVVDELAANGRRLDRQGILPDFGATSLHEIEHRGRRLALLSPGVGAPLAVAAVEEAIARGCRRFVAVGGAGALVPDLVLGHAVVVSSAVRDEGTSYHYVPPSRTIDGNRAARAVLEEVLAERDVPFVTGTTWTTDGLFRETPDKVRRRRDEGCLTVEMEAAAFFALATFRRVPFAQLLYAGDSLAGEEWDHRGWDKASVRRDLFEVAADAALRL
jgi:uridine phosphorylase